MKITAPSLIGILMLAVLMSACNNTTSDTNTKNFSSLIVANEGNFSDGNGSITSFDPESRSVVQQKFEQVNNRPLGGIIQSVSRSDTRLYIVTNGVNKIEVVDISNFESIATIHFGELAPVAIAESDSDKGYVSTLFDNMVHIVDLDTYELTGSSIPVGNNPQQMVIVSGRLYVANGGFGYDNTITVINTSNEEAITTLDVGAGPFRMQVDSENRIWVVCNGRMAFGANGRDPENDIAGRIDILNGVTSEPIGIVETGGFPQAIALNDSEGRAWVVNQVAVQTIDMNSFSAIDESFIERGFNGIGYSKEENLLYLAQSRGYEQAGQAVIYDMDGVAIDSFSTGIAPKEFLFLTE